MELTLQQRAIKQIVNSISEHDLKLMIDEINERIKDDIRKIPLVYKWPDFESLNNEKLIYFLQFIIDMQIWKYIKNVALLEEFKWGIYQWLNENIIPLSNDLNKLLYNVINQVQKYPRRSIMELLAILYNYLILSIEYVIESEQYKQIINDLRQYENGYEQFYIFTCAHINDSILIYMDYDKYMSHTINPDIVEQRENQTIFFRQVKY